MKVLCDGCKTNTAENVHVVLHEINLCEACNASAPIDQVSSLCEKCNRDALECECSYEKTAMEVEVYLQEINDLTMCLFIILNTDCFHELVGKPHLTLLTHMGEKLSQATNKVRSMSNE